MTPFFVTFLSFVSLNSKMFQKKKKMFKIAQKRSQNDPKMAQDWIKLRKIAPKTAQDSPKWVHKVTL